MKETWERYERDLRETWKKQKRDMKETWERLARDIKDSWERYDIWVKRHEHSNKNFIHQLSKKTL